MDYWHFLHVHNFLVSRLVFIDESHVNDRTRARRYGYAPRNQRPTFDYALVRGQRYSVAVAADQHGVLDYVVLRGGGTGHLFFRWFVESLYFTLNADSILVLDGASIHYYEPFRILTEYLGIGLIYLPPYCPFFNPVENIFAAMKALVRRFDLEIEINPRLSLALILEHLRHFNVRGLLRRMSYDSVCRF